MLCKANWGKGYTEIQLIRNVTWRVIVCTVPIGAEQQN